MAIPVSRTHRQLATAFGSTAYSFLDLSKKNPEALASLLEFWRVVGNPAADLQAVTAAMAEAMAWSSPEQLLELAIDLPNPHAVVACAPFADLSSLSVTGTALREGSEEEEESDEKTVTKGFPVMARDERGFVARLMLDRSADSVDLGQIARASGSPTVWCELLPMEGKRVAWLELALGTGHWDTAQRLWEEQGGSQGFDDQARARLAMAWMSGLSVINRADWAKGLDLEANAVFFDWWDRLVATDAALLEPVTVKEGWSNYVVGSSGRDPARELLSLMEAGLEQLKEDKPFDFSQVLLATVNMGGALNRERFTLRPVDLLLHMVAYLGQTHSLAPGVIERMRGIDWTAVQPDEALCTPAVAALRHVSQCEPGWQEKSVYLDLWEPLVKDLPPALQNSWWVKALNRGLSNSDALHGAQAVFEGRFSFDENRFLIKALSRELNGIDEADFRKEPEKVKAKKEMVEWLVEDVMPIVLRSSTPEGQQQWQSFLTPIQEALVVFKESKALTREAWRVVELGIALPPSNPAARPRGPRF